MSKTIFTLKERPIVPLETEVFTPDVIAPLGHAEVCALPVFLGKRQCRLDDFFEVEGAGSDDLCFLTTSKPDEVVQHLKAEGVAIVAGPDQRRGARGTLISVYCRDPDGSLIEIASYMDPVSRI